MKARPDKEEVFHLVAKNHLGTDKFDATPLSGIAKFVYLLSSKVDETKKVIVRLEHMCSRFDKKLEEEIFRTASEEGFGAKELELAENYRVEEYLDSDSVDSKDFFDPEVLKKTMEVLVKFHLNLRLKECVKKHMPKGHSNY